MAARVLGIPTIADRVAQTVVKMVLEPLVEPQFHRDSYGYRPGRSALDAVGRARQRCWDTDWVIDLDIRAFFDSIPHDLVERAVAYHTDVAWVRLYIGRWLRAPVERPDGTLMERIKGTPQGGVVSPLLANLFLHYAFDLWMQRNYPGIRWERYADDAIVHCRSEVEARSVLEAIRSRFAECGLELHAEKTKIVYCKDDDRRGKHEHIKFDFLGYTFQPRRAKNRWGRYFVSFLPAISTKAATAIRQTIREWRMASTRNNQRLEDLARLTNPVVRGWMNYYGRFYRSKCIQVLRHLNEALGQWARRKYKRFKRRERASMHWLGRIAQRTPSCSSCGNSARGRRLGGRSRMRREFHVRFCEGGGVQLSSATRLIVGFEHESDARRFWTAVRDRLEEFSLSLHPEKTRLIQFGRFATARRAQRGLRKPETFNFLGFTFICSIGRNGKFLLKRKTRRDRLLAKLKQVKAEMRQWRHQSIPEQGNWLKQVLTGYFAYYAVQTNGRTLSAFRNRIIELWRRSLQRRSQKDRMAWARITKLVNEFLPRVRNLHPSPLDRFVVKHPRWEPSARIRARSDSVRGALSNERPYRDRRKCPAIRR